MKIFFTVLCAVLMTVAFNGANSVSNKVLAATPAAVAAGHSPASTSATNKPANNDEPASDARKSFDQLKTLAGNWEGRISTNPVAPEVEGKTMHVTLRVTSLGNALLHEMTGADRPDDPITMLYVDDNRLMLTHYCDAGNRPRMTGKLTPDGKTVDFEFLDVAGSTEYGHMHHAKFTAIDANHHSEEWTFMVGDKPVRVHLELQRTK